MFSNCFNGIIISEIKNVKIKQNITHCKQKIVCQMKFVSSKINKWISVICSLCFSSLYCQYVVIITMCYYSLNYKNQFMPKIIYSKK